MIDPLVLHARLLHAADVLAMPSKDVPEMTLGQLAWQRADNWTRNGRTPTSGERGGGMADGADPVERIDDRQEDARASRYRDELASLTTRLDADLHRLERVIAICCPPPVGKLGNRDLQVVQVAAEGRFCASCYRDAGYLEEVAEGRYRSRCRFCGDWRGEHGQDPPKPILVLRHSGRRITTAAVAQAMR